MNIYINSKLYEVPGETNITSALDTLDLISQKGIAIAINNNVVPRAEWETYVLSDEDKVTLIRATQGG